MYQGHKSKPAWNVALYLFNDYSLYQLMLRVCADCRAMGFTMNEMAANILDELRQAGIEKTPDGYRYTKTTVRAALQHWKG